MVSSFSTLQEYLLRKIELQNETQNCIWLILVIHLGKTAPLFAQWTFNLKHISTTIGCCHYHHRDLSGQFNLKHDKSYHHFNHVWTLLFPPPQPRWTFKLKHDKSYHFNHDWTLPLPPAFSRTTYFASNMGCKVRGCDAK